MQAEKDSWIKRNGTNLVVSLLTAALIGTVDYAKKLEERISKMETMQNVHAAKDEDQNFANKERFEKIESLAAEHENEIDKNREDIVRLQDLKQDKK